MTTRQYKNIAASVRQRLLNKARETDRPFNELLQYFAMERFLYRLQVSLCRQLCSQRGINAYCVESPTLTAHHKY
jgi:hypothetical protein